MEPSIPPVALSGEHRRRSLAAMASAELDILVVGAGVVGAGCALDAATRGLRVGLVDAQDFASGTSSRSSKLIHGGLRYLEHLRFELVAEALRERALLTGRLAPHLVRPVPFLFPLRHRGWERLYVGAGVALYDTLARMGSQAHRFPRHRHLTRGTAREVAPALRDDALVGAVQYYDAQVDDARYVVTLVRTAASHGAHVASRARVVRLVWQGDRVTGAVVRDVEDGREYLVRACTVINATGVWTPDIESLSGGKDGVQVRASKGVHLVVPRDRIHSETGVIVRAGKSVLLLIPWGDHWLIGTTDSDWALNRGHPAATRTDIEYLLDQVNKVVRTPLAAEDVAGVYVGLRPLLAGGAAETATLSREHAVTRPRPGLVTVAGGKFTTYRVMAQQAVDSAVSGLAAEPLTRDVPSSRTKRIPLVGAEGYAAVSRRRALLAAGAELPERQVERLLGRYGSMVPELLAIIAADPTLGEPLEGAEGYLRAEVVYAATHEGARHLDDVLTRRTHLSIETFDRGERCAPEAAALMARALGWQHSDVAREVEHYRQRVAAERRSQQMTDDTAAATARARAGDIVPVLA